MSQINFISPKQSFNKTIFNLETITPYEINKNGIKK